MPILDLSKLDIFAFADAESDEAKAFTTYLGYWRCLEERIGDLYGDPPFEAILADLQARKAFRALWGRPSAGDPQDIQRLLLNAWTSELGLHLVPQHDHGRLWLANLWSQVQAYFSTSRVAGAWLTARMGSVPDNHRGLLRAVSAEVAPAGRPGHLYPEPWSLCCARQDPAKKYIGFPSPPPEVHNLARDAEPYGRVAMILRTTRKRAIAHRVEDIKRRGRLERAPKGEARRTDAASEPTTLFDFMWRMRTRSNYGDPALFYVGTLSSDRSSEYASAVRAVVSATMFLFEALLAQKARSILEETATHFISRDRSGDPGETMSDAVIVPRLQALGVFSR